MALNKTNKKTKKEKGFSLIELLVVVAIIGILAAVGVVAYTGYTRTAKINSVKTQHAAISKFIAAEFQKCNLNQSEIFESTVGSQDCTGGTGLANAASDASVPIAVADALHPTFKNAYNGGDESAFSNVSAASLAADFSACTAGESGCHTITYSSQTATISTTHDGPDSGDAVETISTTVTAD